MCYQVNLYVYIHFVYNSTIMTLYTIHTHSTEMHTHTHTHTEATQINTHYPPPTHTHTQPHTPLIACSNVCLNVFVHACNQATVGIGKLATLQVAGDDR